MQVALTLITLDEKTPAWAAKMTRASLSQAIQYNSLTVLYEDEKALRPGRSYVIGELLQRGLVPRTGALPDVSYTHIPRQHGTSPQVFASRLLRNTA